MPVRNLVVVAVVSMALASIGPLVAGDPPSVSEGPFDRLYLQALDGWLYFGAYAAEVGYELWPTNGTTVELVADIYPGPGSSMDGCDWSEKPELFEILDGWIYFNAFHPDTGYELWRSNGVVTVRVGADPTQSLAALIAQVHALELPDGLGRSLEGKLESVAQLLEDAHPGNDVSAVNRLEAFVREVEAQAGVRIPEADAQDLIEAAGRILGLLG